MLLNREGWKVDKYLVERLYRGEGLTLHHRRKHRRRVADQLADGRRFRPLTVVDIHTRECLVIESEQRLKVENVVLALNRIKLQCGLPKCLYCDNRSELYFR